MTALELYQDGVIRRRLQAKFGLSVGTTTGTVAAGDDARFGTIRLTAYDSNNVTVIRNSDNVTLGYLPLLASPVT